MAIWITGLVIVAIVLVMAAFGWARVRRTLVTTEDRGRKDTVPLEMGATLRSYVIPKRWLRAPPAPPRSHRADAEHPRYTGASVELGGSAAGSPSWSLLRGRTRIGRDPDNHVVLDDERISLHHALITVRDGVYWLEDLGSTNGTFVGDDNRVMAPHPLRDGEELQLGGVVLTFRGVAAPDRSPG